MEINKRQLSVNVFTSRVYPLFTITEGNKHSSTAGVSLEEGVRMRGKYKGGGRGEQGGGREGFQERMRQKGKGKKRERRGGGER